MSAEERREKVAVTTVVNRVTDCGSVQAERFGLSQAQPAEMSLTVDSANSAGEARLYRIQ